MSAVALIDRQVPEKTQKVLALLIALGGSATAVVTMMREHGMTQKHSLEFSDVVVLTRELAFRRAARNFASGTGRG